MVRSLSRRTQLALWGAIGLLPLAAVAVTSLRSEGEDGIRVLGVASPTATASADRNGVLGQVVDAEGEPIPPEQQDSVETFTETHGDPPGTDFARIRIPALGVDAPVGRWLVDGAIMPNPYGPTDVAFYDLSAYGGLGGSPGEGANAVFGGHVDFNGYVAYADAQYRGRAVFWNLDRLSPGDIIEVDLNGQRLTYSVVWQEDVPAAEGTDWRQYWTADVPVDSITLFTCGGEFSLDTLSYSHRVVVRAERF